MKKLYLHIGTHKTGTTTIQHGLEINNSILKEHNFYYLTDGESYESYRKCINNFNVYNKDRYFCIYSILPKDIINKIDYDNVIISCENFSWLFSYEEINEVKKDLGKYFDQIKIISYIRRQDRYLISHYQEAAKPNRPASYFYGDEMTPLPEFAEHHRAYLDYNVRLGYWGDVFGDENIIIRVFEQNALVCGDVFSDFLHALGLQDLPVRHPGRLNESTGYIKSKYGHLINRLFKNPQILPPNSPELTVTLYDLLSECPQKYLPDSSAMERYYAHYIDSNIALNRRFHISDVPSIFNEDFSLSQHKSEDDIYSAYEETIYNLLCFIADYTSKKNEAAQDQPIQEPQESFFRKVYRFFRSKT